MVKKIKDFVKDASRMLGGSAVFYVVLGFLMAFLPVFAYTVIVRVAFGLALAFSGGVHLYQYLSRKEGATVLDLFSGAIVLVVGIFLFGNPQIVSRLFPILLGALLLADTVWEFQKAASFRKSKAKEWLIFLGFALVMAALAVLIMVNPFARVRQTVVFSGIIFLLNGAGDIALSVLGKKWEERIAAASPQEKLEQYAEYDGQGAAVAAEGEDDAV